MTHDSAANPLNSSVSLPQFSPAEILPWAIFIGLLLMLGIYFVGVEQGAIAIFNGAYVHEFVHDSRHLLGFPCH
ncbi:CbtB domain-containing protein [Pseudomonas abietaniphila]|uniref:CbtB domain-containing protein n=1 Tax=Pseudomonas abietaniphila TaxID=89065 RepID=UPI000944C889|nr:CbtB-domain containing protein [Pseudomonas abietaniphila]